MSKVQMLRCFVNQRLTAAAEEIFGLFERTIAENEEELNRLKEQNERQQKLLDGVFNPQLRLHRTDVQQLLVVKEEVPPEQQVWSSSLDQEDPEPPHREEQEDPEPPHIKEEQEDPEPPHIKEEQEELWISHEGEQLQGLEEADIKYSFTPVKSEDEEEAQSSLLHQRQTEQMETEADGEDCGGPEPDRNLHPDRHLEPDTDDKTGDSSDTDDSNDWNETREPQSGLNSVKPDEVIVSDSRCSAGEKLFICSECEKTFGKSVNLRKRMRIHTRETLQLLADVQQLLVVKEEVPPEQQELRSSLYQDDPEPPHIKEDQEDPEPPHIKEEQEKLWTSQEGEQLQGLEEADIKFSFTPVKSEDDEEEAQSSQLHQRQTEQMETEADGEDCGGPEPDRNLNPERRPEPDTDDKTGDSDDSDDWKETREPQSGLNSVKPDDVLVSDSRCSAGEKPFRCPECKKTFGTKGNLKMHVIIHTGEKPFSCSVCKTSFNHGSYLQRHMKIHTGEKPFSCSVCKTSFKRGSHLQRHMQIHTGEKPFSCSVCNTSFLQSGNLKTHMRIHTGEKPFSCSVCDKRFHRNGALKSHMKTHTRKNPL